MGFVGWGTILSLRFFSVGLCWGGRTDFSWGLLTLVFHFILFSKSSFFGCGGSFVSSQCSVLCVAGGELLNCSWWFVCVGIASRAGWRQERVAYIY